MNGRNARPRAAFAILACAALLAAFGSCAPSAARAETEASKTESGTARVSFSFGSGARFLGNGAAVVSIQVVGQSASLPSCAFVLPYDADSGAVNASSFQIAIGHWAFTASAFSADGALLYSGESQADIVSGANAVSFRLFEASAEDASPYQLDLSFGRNLSMDEFSQPYGVAVDSSLRLYMDDADNHWIVVFQGDHAVDSIGSSNGWTFNTAHQIAVTPDGSVLWAAERPNNAIKRATRRADSGWDVEQFGSWGDGPLQFKSPMGICLAPNGSVVVAGTENQRVQVISQSFEFISQFSTGDASKPVAVAAWTDDMGTADTSDDVPYIFVLDNGSRCVRKYTVAGTLVASSPLSGEGSFQAEPCTIAADSGGDVFATEFNYNATLPFGNVLVFDSALAPLFTYSQPGSGAGQLDEPRGISWSVADLDGHGPGGAMPCVAIADAMNHRFQFFQVDIAGKTLTLVGSFGNKPANDRFIEPLAIRFDSQNRPYILDRLQHSLKRYDANGRFLAELGGRGDGRLGCDTDLAISSAGGTERIYLMDWGIQALSMDGTSLFMASLPAHDSYPMPDWFWSSLDVGPTGEIYASVQDLTGVARVNGAGTQASPFTLGWASRGEATSSMLTPSAMIRNPVSGELLVADSKNNRIVRLNAENGNYVGYWGAINGAAGAAPGEFGWPHRLAVDAAGNVYVLESGNQRVQVLSSAGVFRSFIGQGIITGYPKGIGVSPDGKQVWVSSESAPCVHRFIKKP